MHHVLTITTTHIPKFSYKKQQILVTKNQPTYHFRHLFINHQRESNKEINNEQQIKKKEKRLKITFWACPSSIFLFFDDPLAPEKIRGA